MSLEITTDPAERAIPPPFVKIDGVDYPMVGTEDLNMEDTVAIRAEAEAMSEILKGENIDQAKAKEVDDRGTALVHRILPTLPDDVLRKLRYVHKLAIVRAFNAAPGLIAEDQGQKQTSSSPGSSDSTEGAGKNGSAREPQPSSAMQN